MNLKGMFLCCREVIPHMIKNGGGNIIAMGSVLSQVAEPRLAAYCASKGAILMLTKSIATDYGRHGIRANCICPGYIDTPLGDVYFEKQPDRGGPTRRWSAGGSGGETSSTMKNESGPVT